MGYHFMQDFFDRVWAQGDLGAVDEMFDPNARAGGLVPQLQVGPEDFHVMVPALRHLIQEIEVKIEHSIQAGDWLWSLVRLQGVAADTGRLGVITGQVMCRIEDGRIKEAYNHFDFMPFFEQLGMLPENTMETLMTGGTIG